MTASKSKICSR